MIPRTLLAVVAFTMATLPALAGTIPVDALPLPNRVANADAVVRGKVTSIEDKTVMAATYPGAKNKTEFKIAVVTIEDNLSGPKGAKTIRLGFVPIPPMVRINPRSLQPDVGMEGVFFLKNHGEADFFTARSGLDFISAKNDKFVKDFALIKHCVKLLETPDASLKAEKAEDRFTTAAMLLVHYRRPITNAKEQPIPAEQSKLILKALAGADWTPAKDFTQLSPAMIIYRVGMTANDGWAPPKDRAAFPAYAQQWLNDHVETFRIQKYVVEKVN